jgi:hypothetical protein
VLCRPLPLFAIFASFAVIKANRGHDRKEIGLKAGAGADEEDSACPSLLGKAEVIRTAGGHHFDGKYGALAQRILDGFRRRAGL